MVYKNYLFRIWKMDHASDEKYTSIDKEFPGFQEMLVWANQNFMSIMQIECLEKHLANYF